MKYIPYALILIIGISCYYYGKSQVKVKEVKVIERKIDTVKVEIFRIERKVVEKEKQREELKEKELAIIFDDNCIEIVDNLKAQLANCDSVVVFKDKIIEKERLIIEYKDVIINSKPKIKPFGIGVQTGVDMYGKPYFGAGVSYNVFRF